MADDNLDIFPDYTKGEITIGTVERHSNLVKVFATVIGTDAKAFKQAHIIASAPGLLAALENLIDRDLIKDKGGDHYDECLEVVAYAKGK